MGNKDCHTQRHNNNVFLRVIAEIVLKIIYFPEDKQRRIYCNEGDCEIRHILVFIVAVVIGLLSLVSCSRQPDTPQELTEVAVKQALHRIGMKFDALSVPKLDEPHLPPRRLSVVDKSMQRPTSMIGLSQRLVDTDLLTGTRTAFIASLLEELLVECVSHTPVSAGKMATPEYLKEILSGKSNLDTHLVNALNRILIAIDQAKQAWQTAGGKPTTAELDELQEHMLESISYQGPTVDKRLMMPLAYHEIGARIELRGVAMAIVQLLGTVEAVLPSLRNIVSLGEPLEFSTPFGRVRVAGGGNDTHTGEYALLIDLGGDDVYQDVGQLPEPGLVSVLIDLSGDDIVHWGNMPGPGAGLLGFNVWLDGAGNDRYIGSNMGMGAGLFGAGVLWDMAGDDLYQGGSMVEGMGEYGIGILIDGAGDDQYSSALYGQGFGGPGGIGIQVDILGNDRFVCGGVVPDQSAERAARHEESHYLGMCQGFGFGIRPDVSGGAGLLLDLQGHDQYQGDLFAQGSAYWFGLGMLVDRSGDDHYEAYEHCQGESVHLAAGFLGDWSGDDDYAGYEHCQGVGKDRAAGILYEYEGNDTYLATKLSQGGGMDPFGVGMLVDMVGNDRYEAKSDSQGIAFQPHGFPDSQWPVGMLLDLGGEDTFIQPGVDAVYTGGRVQGRQGVTIDRSD